MSTFKTKKGTELPLLNLKGKDYLQVQHRVLWFREECEGWGITTEFLRLDDKGAIAKATIRNHAGVIIAQATKSETPSGFGDYIEKSESGAIGRALALCGYGTQFAQELEEGERIVDSPAPVLKDVSAKLVKPFANRPFEELAAFTIKFGKYKGKKLAEIGQHDLNSWIGYINDQPELSDMATEAVAAAVAYLEKVERKEK